jgi:hypothetical protein
MYILITFIPGCLITSNFNGICVSIRFYCGICNVAELHVEASESRTQSTGVGGMDKKHTSGANGWSGSNIKRYFVLDVVWLEYYRFKMPVS